MHEFSPQEGKEEDGGKEHEALTAQKAEKLLFLSYRFSQGGAYLQSYLFRWLHLANPGWKIDAEMQEHTANQFGDHIKKFLGKGSYEHETSPRFHSAIDTSEVQSSAQGELIDMRDFFNGSRTGDEGIPLKTKEELITAIARAVISKDSIYLDKVEGRPRSHEGERMSAATDPFLSHFVYYGLQGHSTGMKEYDELFVEIAACVRENIKNGTWTSESYPELFDVIRIYNEKHADKKVDMDFLMRTKKIK